MNMSDYWYRSVHSSILEKDTNVHLIEGFKHLWNTVYVFYDNLLQKKITIFY